MNISIVIATNNRSSDLAECLNSLKLQKRLPDEVVIAHGGGDEQTRVIVENLSNDASLPFKLKYFNFGPLGAARQRNMGAEECSGEIIFFIDDDIICEKSFIKNIMDVFEADLRSEIGGVSGAITNQGYIAHRRLNKFFFDFCLPKHDRSPSYGGRLVGPAVNFLPESGLSSIQRVDWMPSCCSAYRKSIFLKYKFNESFSGYSFMEDVELSSRVAREYKLIHAPRACVFHKDLGGKTHKSWLQIGRMQVLNRWHVMTEVMNKRSLIDFIRFLYYQFYCVLSESRSLLLWPEAKHAVMRWLGRWLAICSLLLRHLRPQKGPTGAKWLM